MTPSLAATTHVDVDYRSSQRSTHPLAPIESLEYLSKEGR